LDFLEDISKEEAGVGAEEAEIEDTLEAGTEAAGFLADSAGYRIEAAGLRNQAGLIEALESLALLNSKLEVSFYNSLSLR
jgi:hypothetical protein